MRYHRQRMERGGGKYRQKRYELQIVEIEMMSLHFPAAFSPYEIKLWNILETILHAYQIIFQS